MGLVFFLPSVEGDGFSASHKVIPESRSATQMLPTSLMATSLFLRRAWFLVPLFFMADRNHSFNFWPFPFKSFLDVSQTGEQCPWVLWLRHEYCIGDHPLEVLMLSHCFASGSTLWRETCIVLPKCPPQPLIALYSLPSSTHSSRLRPSPAFHQPCFIAWHLWLFISHHFFSSSPTTNNFI